MVYGDYIIKFEFIYRNGHMVDIVYATMYKHTYNIIYIYLVSNTVFSISNPGLNFILHYPGAFKTSRSLLLGEVC